MTGRIGGSYSILGGLVSGICNFKFEAGEKCLIGDSGELADIEMISDISPNENSTEDVDVFIRPQVTFSIPMGYVFEVIDDDGETNSYRAKMTKFSMVGNDTGEEVIGTQIWNANDDVLAFYPDDILPGQTEFTFNVEVQFESVKRDLPLGPFSQDRMGMRKCKPKKLYLRLAMHQTIFLITILPMHTPL